MAPKTKVTKEMILSAVLEITKKTAFSLSMHEALQPRFNAQHVLFSLAMQIWNSLKPTFSDLPLTITANMLKITANERPVNRIWCFLFLILNLLNKKRIFFIFFLSMTCN